MTFALFLLILCAILCVAAAVARIITSPVVFCLLLCASMSIAATISGPGRIIRRFAPAAAAAATNMTLNISARGWDGYLTLPGMATGGTFQMGFASSSNVLTNATMTLTISGYGFDDTGAIVAHVRTQYVTSAMRKAYPDLGTNATYVAPTRDETNLSGSAYVRMSLSDYIYANETVTGVAGAGMYSAGGSYSPTGAFSVVNGSTQTMVRAIANWSYPGFQTITSTTFQLRAVAFHRTAEQGRPVRVVKFWAHDNYGHTNTQYVLSPTVSPLPCDWTNAAIQEYIATMSATDFVQNATVTCHFAAYPWYGTNGVLDTSDGAFTNDMPYYTPFYAPQTWICDTGGTYGSSVAVVDFATGSDSTGVPVQLSAFDSNTPPAAFKTMNCAASRLAASNNLWYGRNNAGNSIIYLNSGTHPMGGSTTNAGAPGKVWLTIAPFPGVSKETCIVTNYTAANTAINRRFKLSGLTCSNDTGYITSAATNLWLDACDLRSPAASEHGGNSLVYVTGCRVFTVGQGFVPYSTGLTYFGLLRGNLFERQIGKVNSCYVAIGNVHTNMVSSGISFSFTPSTTATPCNGGICAFNYLAAVSNSARCVNSAANATSAKDQPHGFAVVGNLLENVQPSSYIGLYMVADDNTNHTYNALVWHNTTVGWRWNINYNDVSNTFTVREQFSVVGNFVDASIAQKSDMFYKPDTGYSGSRVGNWPMYNGCGVSGNWWVDTCNAGLDFPADWAGIGSRIGTYSSSLAYTNNTFAPFVLHAGARSISAPTAGGTGNGDYHLTNAPLPSVRWVLPYDLDGNPRSATTNNLGAYR